MTGEEGIDAKHSRAVYKGFKKGSWKKSFLFLVRRYPVVTVTAHGNRGKQASAVSVRAGLNISSKKRNKIRFMGRGRLVPQTDHIPPFAGTCGFSGPGAPFPQVVYVLR